MPPPPWSLVVPVKTLPLAKTRLAVLAPGLRSRLALALALDTVGATLECARVGAVVVVTDDPEVGAELAARGAWVVPDVPAAGLNAAIRYGEQSVRDRGATGGIAALTADLPALRPGSLGAALAQVPAGGRGFVPDSAGSGTTLLAAAAGIGLDPAYGPDSRRRHEASGAAVLDVPARSGLRRDVDTMADLLAVQALGVGPRTAEVLRELRAAGIALAAERRGSLPVVQGTVATFSITTHAGTLMLDDGTEMAFDRAAFERSGLRLLRSGQRVRFDTTGSGAERRITMVTLVTF